MNAEQEAALTQRFETMERQLQGLQQANAELRDQLQRQPRAPAQGPANGGAGRAQEAEEVWISTPRRPLPAPSPDCTR